MRERGYDRKKDDKNREKKGQREGEKSKYGS